MVLKPQAPQCRGIRRVLPRTQLHELDQRVRDAGHGRNHYRTLAAAALRQLLGHNLQNTAISRGVRHTRSAKFMYVPHSNILVG